MTDAEYKAHVKGCPMSHSSSTRVADRCPETTARKLAYMSQRYQNLSPEDRRAYIARCDARQKFRYHTDPEYRVRELARKQRRWAEDSGFRMRQRSYQSRRHYAKALAQAEADLAAFKQEVLS